MALAMDAFAVSVAGGTGLRRRRVPVAFKTGLFFGGFQALMPILGWLAARRFQSALDAADHWVAFALLAAVGGKMIWESRRRGEARRPACVEDTRVLFLLGVATSLDALAVGVSFSFMGVAVLTPAAVIGLVAFVLSFAGILLGSRLGHLGENRLEAVGGAALILIGIKVLYAGLGG